MEKASILIKTAIFFCFLLINCMPILSQNLEEFKEVILKSFNADSVRRFIGEPKEDEKILISRCPLPSDGSLFNFYTENQEFDSLFVDYFIFSNNRNLEIKSMSLSIKSYFEHVFSGAKSFIVFENLKIERSTAKVSFYIQPQGPQISQEKPFIDIRLKKDMGSWTIDRILITRCPWSYIGQPRC